MLFINLWNLARCDVVKGGFQLRAAKKGQAAPLERIPSDGCQGRLGGDGESQRSFLCQPWCSLSLLALLQLLSFSRLSTHLVIQQMFTESLLCARNQVGLEKGQWQNRPHFSCCGACYWCLYEQGCQCALLSTTPSMPVCLYDALMPAEKVVLLAEPTARGWSMTPSQRNRKCGCGQPLLSRKNKVQTKDDTSLRESVGPSPGPLFAFME